MSDKELLIALISENRNALIPAMMWLKKLEGPEAEKVRVAVERVLDYTTEINRKAGGV